MRSHPPETRCRWAEEQLCLLLGMKVIGRSGANRVRDNALATSRSADHGGVTHRMIRRAVVFEFQIAARVGRERSIGCGKDRPGALSQGIGNGPEGTDPHRVWAGKGEE